MRDLGAAESRPRFRFGRERRLRRRADFLRVQSTGQRVSTPHFVLLVAARSDGSAPEREPSRLGVVATKKVGHAAARNRIKRLCRECFRTWPGFVPNGIDLVVIAREGAHELRLADVRAEWSRARPALTKRSEAALASLRRARNEKGISS